MAELKKKVKAPSSRPRAEGDRPDGFEWSDVGNAERLIKLWGSDMRYIPSSKGWMVWNEKRWVEDVQKTARKYAADAMTGILREDIDWAMNQADTSDEDKAAARRWKFYQRCRDLPKLNACLEYASSFPEIYAETDWFDEHPTMFGVDNGILDLETGELYAPTREQLISRASPVYFDPSATCPTWERFIADVTSLEWGGEQDPELAQFLQRACGYSMSGLMEEQKWFLNFGKGGNGKGAFLSTMSDILGNYAIHSQRETWLETEQYNIPHDLAALAGGRFISVAELNNRDKLFTGRIKDWTDGQLVMKARQLYGRLFDFRPRGKLWFQTNHKFWIEGQDDGVWRRIMLIPWGAKIPKELRDDIGAQQKFKAALAAERPGILAWCWRGFLQWKRHGLGSCLRIDKANAEYRRTEDKMGQWIEERCVVAPDCKVLADDLYESYRNWCQGAGLKPQAKPHLGRELSERGFESERRNSGRYWVGIGLKN